MGSYDTHARGADCIIKQRSHEVEKKSRNNTQLHGKNPSVVFNLKLLIENPNSIATVMSTTNWSQM